eukprot:5219543-Prymnesium_polylepis.1
MADGAWGSGRAGKPQGHRSGSQGRGGVAFDDERCVIDDTALYITAVQLSRSLYTHSTLARAQRHTHSPRGESA